MRGKPAHKVVCDADLIVVGHRCIKHDDTDALRAAVEGMTLEERNGMQPGGDRVA
jgi:hypothetical protein